MSDRRTLRLADDAATEALGAALALALQGRAGGVVHLRGTLGAGKTTFARGWLRALGMRGAIRSPTYTLVEPYSVGGVELLHLDLYRLKTPDELEGLGLDDYPPSRCWWLVEWPDCGGDGVPAADLTVALRADGDGRVAELHGAALPPLVALERPGIVEIVAPNLK